MTLDGVMTPATGNTASAFPRYQRRTTPWFLVGRTLRNCQVIVFAAVAYLDEPRETGAGMRHYAVSDNQRIDTRWAIPL